MFLLFGKSIPAQTQKSAPGAGSFEVEVSGPTSLKWTGTAEAFKAPKGDWGIQLIQKEKSNSPVTSVLIMLPASTKPGGAIPITAYEKAFDANGNVTSVGAVFSSPSIVAINAEGTLSLSSVGPEFTGTFEFHAQSGFDKSQKFTVKGSFNKLPLPK
jgi:hypothetical protein